MEKLAEILEKLRIIKIKPGLLELHVWGGSSFDEVFDRALKLIDMLGVRVRFNFNGVMISVEEDSQCNVLRNNMQDAMRSGVTSVGP